MKKALAFVMACMLLISMSACSSGNTGTEPVPDAEAVPSQTPEQTTPVTTPPSEEVQGSDPENDEIPESLKEIRQWIADADDVFGLAFLGYADPAVSTAEFIRTSLISDEDGLQTYYPFMDELKPEQCCDNGCSELFCIVPPEAGTLVVIEEAETEEGEPTDRRTEVFRGETGFPVYFTLDSNGWGGSNIIISVKTPSGRELQCNPGIYCNLGTLSAPDEVFDLTNYPKGSPAYIQKQITGEWYGNDSADGKEYNLWLTLYKDGKACYEIFESGTDELIREYQGVWSVSPVSIYLDLILQGGTEYDEDAELEWISSEYLAEPDWGWEKLTLSEGESLLPSGADEAVFLCCYG